VPRGRWGGWGSVGGCRGGGPLAFQVGLAAAALGAVCLVPAGLLVTFPGTPLPAAFDPLGMYGWGVLAVVTAAGVWSIRRGWGAGVPLAPLVSAFAGGAGGVLVASALRGWDAGGTWLSFHGMAAAWAVATFGVAGLVRRGPVARGVLCGFAAAVVVCAVRGGWSDPWRPWFPAGLAVGVAAAVGAAAVRARLAGFATASGLAVTLAAVLVWASLGTPSFFGYLLATATGLAAAITMWTLIAIWQHGAEEEGGWLHGVGVALLPTSALLALGLLPAFWYEPVSTAMPWIATSAVALAATIGLWDRSARFARPVLYATGVGAVLLGLVGFGHPPVWDSSLVSFALGAYALVTAAFALWASKQTKPPFRLPARGDGGPWLRYAQSLVAVAALPLGLRTELIAADLWERLTPPASAVIFAAAFVLLVRTLPEHLRSAFRTVAIVLAVYSPAALAWAVPDPADTFVWLDRNGWLFVSLAGAAVVGSVIAPRLGDQWTRAVRGVAGWAAAAAVVVLSVHLLQQVPVYDSQSGRTPLARGVAFAMLAGTLGLMVLALRFALKPDRDPFSLRPTRRTAYVYMAKVLLILFFAQIRFNVPELFLGTLANIWPFVVMALAYVGIGLAELFERKKVAVLALPLRRTGVLLPVVPLLAFWVKPPTPVTEFARDHAPGLRPFLGYLENLPQHFDTYAWLWLLAGGVYWAVALSRRSFGWGLLGALATNAALWFLLAYHQVPFLVHPQAWVIPLALIVLASERINRKRLSAEASGAMRYAGIAMIYVASAADMFIAGVGNSTWLPVILAVLCVVGVLLGILLRVRAFIHLGIGFLLLDLFAMIWYAAVDLQQTWVWYATGIVLGGAVLGLFAYLEKRRTDRRRKPE
jgi:hypothetical protein